MTSTRVWKVWSSHQIFNPCLLEPQLHRSGFQYLLYTSLSDRSHSKLLLKRLQELHNNITRGQKPSDSEHNLVLQVHAHFYLCNLNTSVLRSLLSAELRHSKSSSEFGTSASWTRFWFTPESCQITGRPFTFAPWTDDFVVWKGQPVQKESRWPFTPQGYMSRGSW